MSAKEKGEKRRQDLLKGLTSEAENLAKLYKPESIKKEVGT